MNGSPKTFDEHKAAYLKGLVQAMAGMSDNNFILLAAILGDCSLASAAYDEAKRRGFVE